jgi:membrane-associated phospholipid phosphatase
VHRGDEASLQGFSTLNRPRLYPWVEGMAHLADPLPYALIGLALTGVAMARRRWRVALAVPAVLFATGFTTAQLKHLFASQRLDEWLGSGQISAASWPSGHATASMTLALLAVLVAPARLRPSVAAVGGAFALGVSYAILALRWHFPTDVLGGFLVAATYMLFTLAGLAWVEARHPSARQDAPTRPVDAIVPLGLGVSAGLVGLMVVAARPGAVRHTIATHTSFLVVAGLIGVVALALSLLMAAGLRSARSPSA